MAATRGPLRDAPVQVERSAVALRFSAAGGKGHAKVRKVRGSHSIKQVLIPNVLHEVICRSLLAIVSKRHWPHWRHSEGVKVVRYVSHAVRVVFGRLTSVNRPWPKCCTLIFTVYRSKHAFIACFTQSLAITYWSTIGSSFEITPWYDSPDSVVRYWTLWLEAWWSYWSVLIFMPLTYRHKQINHKHYAFLINYDSV